MTPADYAALVKQAEADLRKTVMDAAAKFNQDTGLHLTSVDVEIVSLDHVPAGNAPHRVHIVNDVRVRIAP
jgi:hypothetical protein